MSNEVINLDRSRKLPIRLRRGQSIDKTILVKNSDGSDFDFTGYSADMLVYNSFNSHSEEFEIVVTLSTGAIRLTHAAITRKREDFIYLFWVTDPTGYRQLWLNGPLTLLNREWDAEDGEDTITISPDGDSVVLTISPLGGITSASIVSALGYTPSPELITTNRQTDSYTLVIGDKNKLVEMNKATANNLTVPPNSDVAFETGTQILISQYGAGQTTVVAGTGVTIRSASGNLKLTGQYSGATLVKIAENEWYLFGDITS